MASSYRCKAVVLFVAVTVVIGAVIAGVALYLTYRSTSDVATNVMNFKIKTEWNNRPINHTKPVEITLTWDAGEDFLTAAFDAPFFDDPEAPDGPAGQPFPQLWEYEVVEIFFLNSQNKHYLEVEVSPHGQHLILLLNGTRNMIEDKLPMKYSATIDRNTNSWTGVAHIPLSYFPRGVDKMNAYAIHGSGDNRVYESLYPVSDGKYQQPDFHRLEYFKLIDTMSLVKEQEKIGTHWNMQGNKEVATDAMDFQIKTEWNSRLINHTKPVEIALTWNAGEDFLTATFDAPFFDDPKAPDGPAGQPFPMLWNYEVVEIFFLNSHNKRYLEVEVSPHGQHLLLQLDGYRNMIEDKLPMKYSAIIDRNTNSWTGVAHIPLSYLPQGVDKMNAYAIHGSGDNRVYESLYPVPEGKYQQPDFHRLEYFKLFDMMSLVKEQERIGTHWNKKVATNAMDFKITTEWNSRPINHTKPVEIALTWNAGEDFLTATFDSPFFDDPKAPDGPAGQPFAKLWDYEVVEIFFLNSRNEHYLEVEVSPHGQHLLLRLNSTRNMIEDKLPMKYSATIDRNTNSWTGVAHIPLSYFPRGVDKMNAYAIHGSGDNRVYESLYPVPDGKYQQPDFHRLGYFKLFDMISLVKEQERIGTHWDIQGNKAVAANAMDFKITTEWNSQPINHTMPVEITLTWNAGEDFLTAAFDAPFFNDPKAPNGPAGQPFPMLWDYEVVEIFFLNSRNEHYLEVEVSPHGQHLLLRLNGTRNMIEDKLPMKYSAIIDRNTNLWTGVAHIPLSYFPRGVDKMNAYAIHGSGDNRVYESLYPVPDGKYQQPDFHRLDYFKVFNMTSLVKEQEKIGLRWKGT